MRTVVFVAAIFLALGCSDTNTDSAAGTGGDGATGGDGGTGGMAGTAGGDGGGGTGGTGGAAGTAGVGGDGGAGGMAGTAGAGGASGASGAGGAGGAGGMAGVGGGGGTGGMAGMAGVGGEGGANGNVCPNLISIIPVPLTILPGDTTTLVQTTAVETDGLPLPVVLTLSALWGSFENTENLNCPVITPDCLQSSNVVFQNATYICELPGEVELCVDATDGLCVETDCKTVTCPADIAP